MIFLNDAVFGGSSAQILKVWFGSTAHSTRKPSSSDALSFQRRITLVGEERLAANFIRAGSVIVVKERIDVLAFSGALGCAAASIGPSSSRFGVPGGTCPVVTVRISDGFPK